MVVRFSVTLILFLALVVMAIIASGGLIGTYINLPSLVLVIPGSLLLTIFSHSPGDVIKMFGVPFRHDAPPEDLKDADVFFSGYRRFVYLMAVIGVIAGIIAVFTYLSVPDHVGSGAALSLLTLLMALVYDAGVVSTLQARVRRQLAA